MAARSGVREISRKTESVNGLLETAAKYKFVLLMVAVGALLLLLPPAGGKTGQDPPARERGVESKYSLTQVETDLEKILSSMDGVGTAEVMLTVRSDSRRIYQENQELFYRGMKESPEEYRSGRETVRLDNGGKEAALQTQEIYPEYLGALVVCDGAGAAGTVLKVKEAVSVLTGLGSERISVVRRSNLK